MKRIMSLVLAAASVFTMTTSAFAAEIPENQNPETAVMAVDYDDYLVENTGLERGTKPPSASNFHDLDDTDYTGRVDLIRTGVYTNYCFKPNSSGELYVDTSLIGNVDMNGAFNPWKVRISVYDMSGNYVKETQEGRLHSVRTYCDDSFTFSGLNTSRKYCVFIAVYNEVCQVSGDVIVSH